jgi:hypothetical protein
MRRSLAAFAALAAVAVWGFACGGSKPQEPAPRPGAKGALQAAGTYSYATRGHETLTAIVPSRHDYPPTSTVTVTKRGCGFTERWVPRPERSSEWRFCVRKDRWRLALLLDDHEFFGQLVRQRFACRGPFVPRPTVVPVGFRWTDRCRGAGSRVTVGYRAVREQALRIGGKRVETVLVHARARLRGRIDGLNTYDSWLSRTNGLVVRREVTSDTAVKTPFGKVTDGERYLLRLKSLRPGQG